MVKILFFGDLVETLGMASDEISLPPDITDVERLCAVESEGIAGVICGRSIYTGALDFTAAQRRADELAA